MTDFAERVRSQLETPREFSSSQTDIILGGKALSLFTPLPSELEPIFQSLSALPETADFIEQLQTDPYPVGVLPPNIPRWVHDFSERSESDTEEWQNQLITAWEILTWLDHRIKNSQDVILVVEKLDKPDKIAQSIADAAMSNQFATGLDNRVARLIETITSMDPLVNVLHDQRTKQKVDIS